MAHFLKINPKIIHTNFHASGAVRTYDVKSTFGTDN